MMIINRSAHLGAFLLFLLFLIGCKKDNVDSINTEIDIEEEFRIIPFEVLGSNGRNFHIIVETIDATSCQDAEIKIDKDQLSNGVELVIKEIINNSCPSGSTIAIGDVELGALNISNYDLNISLQSVIKNPGQLFVNSVYYELDMHELQGIVVPNNRLYKVPQNTIWGYVDFDNSDDQQYSTDFTEAIRQTSTERIFNQGFYGYYSISEDDILTVKDEQTKNIRVPFIFEHDEIDVDDLNDILSDYRTNHPNMEFVLKTSIGVDL